jgi:hypothetical protein
MQLIKPTFWKMATIKPLFENASSLTPLKVEALRMAYKMQSNNEPFGQIDIYGSFAALLRTGFINTKTIIVNQEILVSWYVTSSGKYALLKLGFSDNAKKVNY